MMEGKGWKNEGRDNEHISVRQMTPWVVNDSRLTWEMKEMKTACKSQWKS